MFELEKKKLEKICPPEVVQKGTLEMLRYLGDGDLGNNGLNEARRSLVKLYRCNVCHDIKECDCEE